MNNVFKLIIAVCTICMIHSCKDEQPSADFDYYVIASNGDTIKNPAEVIAQQKVYFRSLGKAGSYAIWPGDSTHNYDKKDDFSHDTAKQNFSLKNNGIALSKNGAYYEANYIYNKQNTYTMYLVASNVQNDGVDVTSSVVKKTISIKDTSTELSSIDITHGWFTHPASKEYGKYALASVGIKKANTYTLYVPASYKKFGINKLTVSILVSGDAVAVINGLSILKVASVDLNISAFPYSVVVTSPSSTSRTYNIVLEYK